MKKIFFLFILMTTILVESQASNKMSEDSIIGVWKTSSVIMTDLYTYDFEKDTFTFISESILESFKKMGSDSSNFILKKMKESFKGSYTTFYFNGDKTYTTISANNEKVNGTYILNQEIGTITFFSSKSASLVTLENGSNTRKFYLKNGKLILKQEVKGNELFVEFVKVEY